MLFNNTIHTLAQTLIIFFSFAIFYFILFYFLKFTNKKNYDFDDDENEKKKLCEKKTTKKTKRDRNSMDHFM